jgi:hypothetical protein
MIAESSYWKRDLLRQARYLRDRLNRKRWSEASLAKLERTLLLGFYAIRKLCETHKLSMSTIRHDIPVTSFKPKGSPVTVINWPQLDAHYDLAHPKRGTVNLLFIVNQFIHSYIFLPCYDDRGCVYGVFVSSD